MVKPLQSNSITNHSIFGRNA
ncbi:hypothetical protein X801_02662 [Opisthorchis viverrini]|uniref:Uncharacterized protein n=1 Tax=Opisthorchis viverrini TaxID=6198 RepID=A0A1S8X3Z0_OPIVI|nr:hypothetical protein X801_02662 [Opisthorchis viverrini]